MAHEQAARVQQLLVRRQETLATAESLTGGLLGQILTGVPGASAYYRGGVISYATEVKTEVLGVDRATIADHGAVSPECAAEMAAGALRTAKSTWAVSTTGVAGPEPQEGKPVGLVHVAVAGPRSSVRTYRFDGDREAIRGGACEAALVQLLETIDG